jgi:TonB family protein
MENLEENKNVLLYILIFVFSLSTCFGESEYAPIKNYGDESTIIIRGKLIDKYFQRRTSDYLNKDKFRDADEEIIKPLFTVFLFSVIEVIKGNIEQSEIEVLMQGGCENKECTFNRTKSFSYEKGEDADLILKARLVNPDTYRFAGLQKTTFVIGTGGKVRISWGDVKSKKENSSLNSNENIEPTLNNSLPMNVEQYSHAISTNYPRHLAAAGIEGFVTVEFSIDGSYAKDIKIIESSPVGVFDQLVLKAMKLPYFHDQVFLKDNSEVRYRYTYQYILQK